VQSPKRWLAIAGVTLLSLVAVGGVAIAIYTAWLFHDLPDAGDLVDYRPPTSTRAYAWDGTLIGEFSRERRIFIPYDTIPPHLALAFLALRIVAERVLVLLLVLLIERGDDGRDRKRSGGAVGQPTPGKAHKRLESCPAAGAARQQEAHQRQQDDQRQDT
jgi:hypothetical protein